MHIIANWMSKNTTYQRTLNFAYSESNNDKKHQKIPKEVDFQNIEIDRSVLVENVKTLVKKINDLNSTKFAPLDAWQFLDTCPGEPKIKGEYINVRIYISYNQESKPQVFLILIGLITSFSKM